jgi:hypothetical protein
MPDAGCDELSGGGIYHDGKPGQGNDATDYSRWMLRPQCKTPDVRPLNTLTGRWASESTTGSAGDRSSLVGKGRVIRPTSAEETVKVRFQACR